MISSSVGVVKDSTWRLWRRCSDSWRNTDLDSSKRIVSFWCRYYSRKTGSGTGLKNVLINAFELAQTQLTSSQLLTQAYQSRWQPMPQHMASGPIYSQMEQREQLHLPHALWHPVRRTTPNFKKRHSLWSSGWRSSTNTCMAGSLLSSRTISHSPPSLYKRRAFPH